MTDFNPKEIGPYIPPGMASISFAHKSVVKAFYHVKPKDFITKPPATYYPDEGYLSAVYAGGIVPNDDSLREVAWRFVRHELISTFLHSFVVDPNGSLREVANPFWATDYAGVVLSSGYMSSIDSSARGVVVTPMSDLTRVYQKYMYFFLERFWNVFGYSESETKRYLDFIGLAHPSTASAALPAPTRLLGGGRPVVYDVEQFLLCAFSLLSGQDPPTTQAELGRKAAEAYRMANGKGGHPSEAWVKARVRRLWAVLRKDNNG